MKDRESLYPGRVQLTPVPGQPNLFDLVRADQPTEPGTMLNKANLFRDTTALSLGLPPDAVPDDGFNRLADGVSPVGTELTSLAALDTGIAVGTWLPLDGRIITRAAYPELFELAEGNYDHVLEQTGVTVSLYTGNAAASQPFVGKDDGKLYQAYLNTSLMITVLTNGVAESVASPTGLAISYVGLFETKTRIWLIMGMSSVSYIFYRNKTGGTFIQQGTAPVTTGTPAYVGLMDYDNDVLWVLSSTGAPCRIRPTGNGVGVTFNIDAGFHYINERLFATDAQGFLWLEYVENPDGTISTVAITDPPPIFELRPRYTRRCANGRYFVFTGLDTDVARTLLLVEADQKTVVWALPVSFGAAFTNGVRYRYTYKNMFVIESKNGVMVVTQSGAVYQVRQGTARTVLNYLCSFTTNLDGESVADELYMTNILRGTGSISAKLATVPDVLQMPGRRNGFVRAL